jgi:Flp pilus assembly secretin CpaC
MRRNLIYGSICLAALSCFAVLAVAQQRPAAPQQPATAPAGSDCTTCPQNVPAPQSVTPKGPQYTHYIEMPPGITIRFESPQPFASVVPGNTDVADAVPGPTDRLLAVTSKTVTGATNFLMLDRNGQEVANLLVNVRYPPAEWEVRGSRVQIHSKKLVHSYYLYRCSENRCQLIDELAVKEPAELPTGHQKVDQSVDWKQKGP